MASLSIIWTFIYVVDEKSHPENKTASVLPCLNTWHENDCKPVTKQTYRMPATTRAKYWPDFTLQDFLVHCVTFTSEEWIIFSTRKPFTQVAVIQWFSKMFVQLMSCEDFLFNMVIFMHFWPPVQLHVFNEVSKCEQHAPFILTIYDQVIFPCIYSTFLYLNESQFSCIRTLLVEEMRKS